MPTGPSGIYTLPSSYLAVSGETIRTEQHNPPLEDIAQALTDRLPRSGVAPMTGNLQMGGNKVTNLAEATSAGDAVPFGQFAGMIVMWSGTVASIPAGWAVCDGSNGTPDLRDKFIVCVGDSYAPGDTGGVNSVTLSVEQMPAHNHTGATGLNGAHNHTVDVTGGFSANQGGEGASNAGGTTVVTSTAPNHNHSIASQGGGQAHENRPPYYALALIMKL